MLVIALASALGTSEAAYSCSAQNEPSPRVCKAAKRMQIPLHTLPVQTDGRDAVMARFKKIGDLGASNVRAFVREHPENTEYLIKYLTGLDSYYLRARQRSRLVNTALHELLVVSNDSERRSEKAAVSHRLLSQEYRVDQEDPLDHVSADISAEIRPTEQQDEREAIASSNQSESRTFQFDFAVGYARAASDEQFFVGTQALNSYEESITQPYVAIRAGLLMDESLGLGLKVYDSYRNTFTVPANPASNLGSMRVYRDWKGGVSPFIYYNWRPPWTSVSGYVEYGRYHQKVDNRLTGTAAGVPYDVNWTAEVESRNVFLGLGYRFFDSWLVRLMHHWSKVQDTREITGYGLEIQSDF